jgi:hypothetical protein
VGAGGANVCEQPENGMFRHAGHVFRAANGILFDEGNNDLDTFAGVTHERCGRLELPSNHHEEENSMPKRVWLYLAALVYYHPPVSCTALAEGLQTVSHDGLTRLLQADWSGPALLELAWRTLFVSERGYLILNDTVLPKPFATAIEGLAWM